LGVFDAVVLPADHVSRTRIVVVLAIAIVVKGVARLRSGRARFAIRGVTGCTVAPAPAIATLWANVIVHLAVAIVVPGVADLRRVRMNRRVLVVTVTTDGGIACNIAATDLWSTDR
jgi:hypothetical protein